MDRYQVIQVHSAVTGGTYTWYGVLDIAYTGGSATPVVGQVIARFKDHSSAQKLAAATNQAEGA